MIQESRTTQLLRRLAGNSNIISELGPGRVAMVVSSREIRYAHTQLVTAFAANLLARLFPVVRQLDVWLAHDSPRRVRIPRWSERTVASSIRRFFNELRPPARCQIRIGLPSLEYDAILGIGATPNVPATVYVGGSGWLAMVSTEHPVPFDDSPNPVGAYAAASFAVSEVWKQLLAPSRQHFPNLAIVPLDGTLSFSSFDYSHHDEGPNPALPQIVDLSRLTIIGLGTGGSAAAYTLASLENLRGHLTLIEPDEVTEPNLNRLVMSTADDAKQNRPKVAVAADLFRPFKSVSPHPLQKSFDAARDCLTSDDFRRVISAVHSRVARHSIQRETPEVLWDAAATETGEFFVWRVAFGQTPCLACRLSVEDKDPERSKAQQLCQLLDVSPETWLRKIRDNEVFTPGEVEYLDQRVRHLACDLETPMAGQRFGDWEAEQCGKLHLPEPDDEIPIPFAPVLAGVLLAGEALKRELFPEAALDSYYWNTLLGQFMMRNRCHRPMRRPGCPICGRSEFRQQYRRRWDKSEK